MRLTHHGVVRRLTEIKKYMTKGMAIRSMMSDRIRKCILSPERTTRALKFIIYSPCQYRSSEPLVAPRTAMMNCKRNYLTPENNKQSLVKTHGENKQINQPDKVDGGRSKDMQVNTRK